MEKSCLNPYVTNPKFPSSRLAFQTVAAGKASPPPSTVAFPMLSSFKGIGKEVSRVTVELRTSAKRTAAEEEIVTAEEAEEWRGKCGEIREEDMVELLECLEREAIMGDDEGKEPSDYDRRAQIFDKSSQVFEALRKQNNNNNTSTAST